MALLPGYYKISRCCDNVSQTQYVLYAPNGIPDYTNYLGDTITVQTGEVYSIVSNGFPSADCGIIVSSLPGPNPALSTYTWTGFVGSGGYGPCPSFNFACASCGVCKSTLGVCLDSGGTGITPTPNSTKPI